MSAPKDANLCDRVELARQNHSRVCGNRYRKEVSKRRRRTEDQHVAVLDNREEDDMGFDVMMYRLRVLMVSLRLEIMGMKRSRAPSAYSALRKMGFRGSRESVLEQIESLFANN